MNPLSPKTQILLAVLTAIFIWPASSTTFNPLYTAGLENRASQNALLTDGGRFIYYRDNGDQDAAIVSLNLNDMSEIELLKYQSVGIKVDSPITQLKNGRIILRANINNNSQLWVSSGQEPFSPLTSDNLSILPTAANQLNGFYFIERNNQSIVWTDGAVVKNQAFSDPVIPLCAFSSDLFLFTIQKRGVWQFSLFDQGEITDIFDGYNYHSSFTPAAHTSESCIIKASNSAGEAQHLFYHQDGRALNTYRSDESVKGMADRFVAVDVQVSPFIPNQINTLDPTDFQVIDSYQFNNNQFRDLKLARDRVHLFLQDSNNSQLNKLTLLSQSLSPQTIALPLTPNSHLYSTYDKDYLVDDNYLSTYQNGFFQNKLPLNNQLEYIFYNNLLSNDMVFVTTLTETSVSSEHVFKINILPDIGNQLNGPWFDVNYPNQGLSINPGKRVDGSHYIFLTFFLFRDGQPFWLAGNENYIPGQQEITINLFDFKGANFLDDDTLPEQNTFGTITLSFNSCDGLDGLVSFDNQTQDFDFQRIDDASFNYRCVKP